MTNLVDSKLKFSHNFRYRMLVLAVIIGLGISVTMPTTYLVLSLIEKRDQAITNSQDIASKMSESVRENPVLWMYNAQKFAEIQSFYRGKDIAAVNILDNNRGLTQRVELLEASSIKITGFWPVIYNNQVYGYVEVVQESDSIIRFSALIFVAFFVLGVIAAFSLYRFPTGFVARAENEVLRTYRELHYITFSLGEGVCVTDLTGNITFTNPAAERMLGWPKDGMTGLKINDIFFDNLSVGQETSSLLRLVKQGKSKRIYEDSLVRKDGLSLPVSYVISPIKENGRIIGCVIVFHDITRRKQNETELRSRETALRRITDNMLDMISETDVSGIIRYVTPSYRDGLGYEPEELLRKSFFELIHEDDRNRVISDIGNSMICCSPQKMEFRIKHANGEYLWIESLTNFLGKDADNGQGIIFCTRDVTERKYLQEEVARLDRLHLIGEMAAGIGHEIRNPMTTVRGFLQMLSSKEENLCYKDYYTLMIDELDRANSIIKEYLNLAKNKNINLKVQNLNAVINAIYPLIQADAMLVDKRVLLDLSTLPELPIDEKEIRQLILNLIRNGLEAMSPGGCVLIKTALEPDNVVVLSVRDQGKGIDSTVLDRLGTPFFTTKDSGTGLGLAVCYSIAARHNAKIEVASGPRGSTFSVKFYSAQKHNLNGTLTTFVTDRDSKHISSAGV